MEHIKTDLLTCTVHIKAESINCKIKMLKILALVFLTQIQAFSESESDINSDVADMKDTLGRLFVQRMDKSKYIKNFIK